MRPLKQRLLIYALVVLAVSGGSFIGPVSNKLPTKKIGVYINLCWRFIPMTFFLVVCNYFSKYVNR
jgi:hypothetical protein